MAMQKSISVAMSDRTVPCNSKPYNPQSSGGAEKAVQDVTDMIRRLLLGVEARLKAKLDLRMPCIAWLFDTLRSS